MHGLPLLLLILLLSDPAHGQSPSPDRAEDPLPARSFTATAGAGTSMGWFGAQVERYLLHERLSLFGGLGYAFAAETGQPAGPAVAAGVRLYSDGLHHRAFLELAAAQLATSASRFGDERISSGRHYGPAVLGGYQFVAGGGFTVVTALGFGYAPALADDPGDPWTPALDLGIGYTWRK